MRNAGIWVLLAVLGLLSGCAQYQQQQAQKQMTSAAQAVTAVCAQTFADPRFDVTRSQISDSPLKTTVAQMADTRYPTPAQRNAIEHREDYSQPCIDAWQKYLAAYAPAALPIYQEAEQEERARLASLLSGKVTFGEFNTVRARAITRAWADMQSAERARVAAAQRLYLQQQQTNLVQQQAIQNSLYLMQQSMKPAPAVQPMLRTTNCYGSGRSIQCQSF